MHINYNKKRAIGGLSTDFGEGYKKEIACSLALQLLNLDEEAYLQIEESGDDLRFFDGRTLYFIECKKHTPKKNNWTISNLISQGVIDFFIEKYQENKENKADFKLVLISSEGCKELERISDLFRKGQENLVNKNDVEELNLPQELNRKDFFSRIYICTQSDFAIRFLTDPIFNAAYEPALIDEIKRFIFEEGSKREKISLDILEKLPGVKNWLSRKKLVNIGEKESVNIARFYRKSLSIKEVKAELNKLKKLYKTDLPGFQSRVRIYLLAYNNNFKLIMGILNLFKNKLPINEENAGFLATNISGNPLYQWHFFKNLEKPDWFPLLKDSLISEICEYKEDYNVKFLLLNYFRRVLPDYQSEIISLLQKFRKNTSYYNILSELVKIIGDLRKDDNRIWSLLDELACYPHPWVRKEIPKALKNLAKFNPEKVLGILKKLILYKSEPVDVTQGTPTLALTFQGRDNENFIFEEAMNTLSYFLKKFPERSFPLACDLLETYIGKEGKNYSQIGKIFDDYSYIWYSDKDISKRKYEYDRKERLGLEIEAGLRYFITNNPKKAKKICDVLISHKYAIFYLILLKSLPYSRGLRELKSNLINNLDIWYIRRLRQFYLQNLIKHTIENLFQAQEADVFIDKIKKFNCKDKEKEKYIKCDVFQAIPEQYQDTEIKKYLENCGVINQDFQKPFQVITGWVPDEEIKIGNLRKKGADEIIKIMKAYSKVKRKVDLWDLGIGLENLAKEKPKIVIPILKKINNKKVNQELIGRLVAGFIKANIENLREIIKPFPFLRKSDNWAKVEIARALEEKYKKADRLSKSLLNKANKVLVKLSSDPNPKPNRILSSSKPNAMDLLTTGINSIRGITAQAAVYYLFYYPEDAQIIKLVRRLGKDRFLAVRACVINTMGWLTGKGLYNLTQEILKPFENQRIAGIDICIVHYLSFLNKSQLRENKDWIKRLLINPDPEIQNYIAELIGQRFIDEFDVGDLVKDIIEKKIGTKEARRSLAFVFESRLGNLYSLNNKMVIKNRILNHLKRLMDPSREQDIKVRERAAFLFERDNIKEDYFKFFYNSGVFEIIGSDIYNARAQGHVINYLKKCKEKYLNDSIAALSKIVKKDSLILGDSLAIKNILDILKEGFNRPGELHKNNRETLEKMFDLVLERGWEEAYQLFYELLNK
mgnify:CR=1 FL=1